MRHRKLAVSLLLAAGVLLAATGRADELEKILKRRLSPGALALLAKYPRDPRVAERLKTAVRSPEAATRAVAARVINLGVAREALDEVAGALAVETDADAALEQIRTLLSVGGTAYDAPILAAARRLTPGLDRPLVRMMARSRGFDAIPLYFQTLRELKLSAQDREAFFRLATRGAQPPLVASAATAFGRNDTASWQAVLAVAAEFGHDLGRPVLLEALRSGASPIRGEAAWYLARLHSKEPPSDRGPLLNALSEPAPAPEEDPELRFGAEILRRVLGEKPVEDEGWIACLETNLECHLDSDFGETPLVRFLTPREREALERRNATPSLPPEFHSKSPRPPKPKLEQELRLVTGVPRGLVRDLFEVEGCRPRVDSHAFSFAALKFRPDGLPGSVGLLGAPRDAGCQRAAQSLFLMAMAPADESVAPDATLIYAAPLNPDEMTCNEGTRLYSEAQDTQPSVRRVRGEVQAPRLVKEIKPIYPAMALKNRESGVSIFEAVITPAGCVRDLRLWKSSTLMLDVAALHAISQWRYKPATLDGRPVSVYLTVTVTFNPDPPRP